MSNNDMSIIDHLEEFRWRVLKSLSAILFMSIITFNFANDLVALLIAPASQISGEMNLQVLTIQGMFMLKWNLAMIGGIIFSMPFITIQIWKFLSPGLYDKERKILLPLILTAFGCFMLGGFFAYKVILPFSLDFFASMITGGIENNFSINYYFNFVLALIIGSGAIFELPVASFLFSSIGLINPKFLRQYRREAIMGTVVLSAIITPPDPISLIIMSIPMIILYEISIFVSWFANKLFNQDL
ncbi:MAG: twin-arginine translocase subunit TatC [Candidatus Marinimicrobia bacterium]|nr:twin-arginine translocase subunit TatC [Gammaproteobacteria bacterium]MBL6911703.1 twin-arginine translocase subunit TatC [Candidatus Neomarinimicrobiota bacterium]MBT3728138.1 twin-arginine translocase subunit TatC [Candidatus Neomarinimicrobiota bacterium]MBT3944222.1 twin-arginine translocase subunit TatC [Candidatus Neomarinimicrobiota bacterium]MBT4112083.1 twin-arginine translocase subunit TatC [Candidatus Neomarinimicrobiota bacterium]